MHTINLLPLQQNAAKAKIKQTNKIFYLCTFSMVVFLLTIYLFFDEKINDMNKEITQLKLIQKNQEPRHEKAEQLSKKISTYQKDIEHVKVSQDESMRLKGFLNELPHMLPANVYLVNLSWHEHSGIMYGQAMNAQDVTQFMQSLKSNPYFKKINLIKSDRRHEKDGTPPIYFVINFYA